MNGVVLSSTIVASGNGNKAKSCSGAVTKKFECESTAGCNKFIRTRSAPTFGPGDIRLTCRSKDDIVITELCVKGVEVHQIYRAILN